MRCAAAVNECSIDHAGNLYPCRLMTLPDMCCGNLLNQEFKTLWEESSVLWQVRNLDYSAIEKCRDCAFFRLCLGGYRAMAQKKIWRLALLSW
ncbi:MAG: SPASM domain-containing protein [Candidatus Sabulitectum sp.]|nr:SPASM domain-containing protein [Candidatus Sabulitectum sp.]